MDEKARKIPESFTGGGVTKTLVVHPLENNSFFVKWLRDEGKWLAIKKKIKKYFCSFPLQNILPSNKIKPRKNKKVFSLRSGNL